MKEIKRQTTIKIGNRFLTPNGIGSNGLDIHDCIAEIIANCFDWNISKINKEEVKIKLIFGSNYIQIIDNGVGMTDDELDIAINLAEAEDALRAKISEAERKGMYGMGLKIAALSLGWKFTIKTISHSNPTKEHSFEFNSRNLLDNNSTYLEDGLFIKSNPVINVSDLFDFKHGTSILIEDLEKKTNISKNVIKDELQSRFMPDINSLKDNSGLSIEIIERSEGQKDLVYAIEKLDISRLFEDEVLKVDFENPSKWAKRAEYIYTGKGGKQFKLKGFLQLLKKRSVKDQFFGLNLYYQGQLIERFHKGLLLKEASMGRGAEKLYGELHLDGCEPDPSKKSFKENAAFREVAKLIYADLQVYKKLTPATGEAKGDIIKEVNKRKGIDTTGTGTGVGTGTGNVTGVGTGTGTNAGAGTVTGVGTGTGNGVGTGTTVEENPDTILARMPEGTIFVHKRIYIQITKEWIYENPLEESRGVNWDSAYIQSTLHNDLKILKVYINPSSELFKTVRELYEIEKDQNKILDFYKRIAVCECIYDKLMEIHGYTKELARETTDKIIYPQVLKLKSLK